jgi:predicted DNA-binding transcriptional regulator AlpA
MPRGPAARSRMQDRAAISCTPVAAPKVMGLYEIAQYLGISKRYARQLADRKGFPDPTRLHMGQVWSAADVESWAAKNRPPKDAG